MDRPLPPGARDNGLRSARYTAVGDLDPRVAGAGLTLLAEEGIAAYAVPTPGAAGGSLELRLPARPLDRLWVDEAQTGRARELLAELEREPGAAAADVDLDTAWQQGLASLQAGDGSLVPPWPVSEDVAPSPVSTRVVRPAAADDDDVDEQAGWTGEDEHFLPPPPPPLPRLAPATILSVLAIVLGAAVLLTNFDDGRLNILAILGVAAGAGVLIWRMRDGPPTDSGWDDGAVL